MSKNDFILSKFDEFDTCAIVLDGTMVLGYVGCRWVYAAVDAPDEVYFNSEISTDEAYEHLVAATTLQSAEEFYE